MLAMKTVVLRGIKFTGRSLRYRIDRRYKEDCADLSGPFEFRDHQVTAGVIGGSVAGVISDDEFTPLPLGDSRVNAFRVDAPPGERRRRDGSRYPGRKVRIVTID